MAERYMAHSMATYTGDPAAMCLMTRRSTHNKSIGSHRRLEDVQVDLLNVARTEVQLASSIWSLSDVGETLSVMKNHGITVQSLSSNSRNLRICDSRCRGEHTLTSLRFSSSPPTRGCPSGTHHKRNVARAEVQLAPSIWSLSDVGETLSVMKNHGITAQSLSSNSRNLRICDSRCRGEP
jgi:hypothetical protein